ncbi:DUF3221 domain-containing protein [Ureibacillus sp. GCM10028918]|uniref:DUF3221 domain-containing protein n=1 Tax=Ureibacillus sp. GCM10028918 TaxID=3273429 RepID=UPI00361B7C40
MEVKLNAKVFINRNLFSILVACNNENEKFNNSKENTENIKLENDVLPSITGEIVNIENGRFLVESTTKKLPDGSPDAIWFSTDDIKSLKVGQNVSVWTSAIDTSYPGQASADKVEINEK